MLDKTRNKLIKHSFQLAGILSPESDMTAEEMTDAADILNSMLQSWNNDGFRLFKIKTGYMPFINGKNEYSLASEAYKSFGGTEIKSFYTIGATKLKLKSMSGVSVGQKVSIVSNSSESNEIKSVDYDNGIIELKTPTQSNVNANNNVFFGDYNTASTEIKTNASSFNTIKYTNASVTPIIGDALMFSINGSFVTVKITDVNTGGGVITFTPTKSGNIDNTFIAYGDYVRSTKTTEGVELSVRKIEVSDLKFSPLSLGIPEADNMSNIFDVESVDGNSVILKQGFNEATLNKLGFDKIFADIKYPVSSEVVWTEFGDISDVTELDWGTVNVVASETDDWGMVTESAEDLEDWETLTGTAEIVSYAKDGNYSFVIVTDGTTNYLYYKALGGSWTQIDVSSYDLGTFKLYQTESMVVLYDTVKGAYSVASDGLSGLYTTNGVESVIHFNDLYYLISPKSGSLRTIVSTSNFSSFSASWQVALGSIANPAVFLGKLFLGTTNTTVTSDMKSFSDIDVYSDNRCVVGDRLMNLNTERICTYTLDGEHFLPMPMTLSNQSAWAYKDGCSFIGIYGAVEEGVMGTQIFTANDFNPIWVPQTIVKGRVFDIHFYSGKAYFVSDVQAKSLTYTVNKQSNNSKVYYFGEQIGRPQEVMNVIKNSLISSSRLPMTTVALKDYALLPKSESGEPTSYCFFRDAIDGKMMVWGTPNKFGEYLRFSYVEPITLLEDARSTPDFPDEYYQAVEDGLAAELAYHYQLPVDRIQALVAKAELSKERATLHDNEDASYIVSPNQRGL